MKNILRDVIIFKLPNQNQYQSISWFERIIIFVQILLAINLVCFWVIKHVSSLFFLLSVNTKLGKMSWLFLATTVLIWLEIFFPMVILLMIS